MLMVFVFLNVLDYVKHVCFYDVNILTIFDLNKLKEILAF